MLDVRPAPYTGPSSDVADLFDAVTKERPWTVHAECRDADTNLFFGEVGYKYVEARRYCASCPVVDDCLADALTHPASSQYGFVGGLTAPERQALLKGKRPDPMSWRRILNALGEGHIELTVPELASRTGLSERHVWRVLDEMGPSKVRTRTAFRGQVWFRARPGRNPK